MEALEQAEKVKQLLSEYKAKEQEMKLIYAELKSEALKLKMMFEEMDVEDYLKTSKETKIKLTEAKYYKFSKDSEQVMQWLEEKGYKEQYVTVNAQAFNALIANELESNPDFELPSFVEKTEWMDLKIDNFNLTKKN